jgi:hypothetical protein
LYALVLEVDFFLAIRRNHHRPDAFQDSACKIHLAAHPAPYTDWPDGPHFHKVCTDA